VSRTISGLLVVLTLVAAACTTAAEEPTESPPRDTSATTTPTEATTSPRETTTTSALATTTTPAAVDYLPADELGIEAFPVPAGSRPHDVAPAADGGVWYTAQGSGELGWLDPVTGETVHVALGAGSRPHGVIVDDDGTPWVTDSGLNAIVGVDPASWEVTVYPLPDDRPDTNLNTATFDGSGVLWFTGQGGVYGSLEPSTGEMVVYDAPEGRGPYGITATPSGSVFYASLAGSHIAAIAEDGSATVLEPPTPEQGARRVWSDSTGAIWVAEWNTGSLSRYLPDAGEWATWPLPGDDPAAYAVYVDEADIVWVSDFGANAMVRFDPASQGFTVYPLPHDPGEVRQILGRPGEVWAAESAADHLILINTR
jgi:virginiamycin B lyase